MFYLLVLETNFVLQINAIINFSKQGSNDPLWSFPERQFRIDSNNPHQSYCELLILTKHKNYGDPFQITVSQLPRAS